MPEQQIPLVSVILPVYNAAQFVEESIKSILNQTYTNFELIIINDGSTDESEKIISRINDKRIRYYYQPNIGLAKTLNRGIEVSNGEFIARQDADDISLPQRIEKQIQFLLQYTDISLLGSWAEIIPIINNTHRYHKHPADNLQLKIDLLFNNPFVHTSIMIRKGILKSTGYYNPDKLIEDFDLWSRIGRSSKLANIPEVLVQYREVQGGLSRISYETFWSKILEQSFENIKFWLPEDAAEITQFCNLYFGNFGELTKETSLGSKNALLNKLIHKIVEDTGEAINTVTLKMNGHFKTINYRYYRWKQKRAGKNILMVFWFKLRYRISIIERF
jgi:glycosyltransferase involved in cell wall biosynthesis